MISIKALGKNVEELPSVSVETPYEAEQEIKRIWLERNESGSPDERSSFMAMVSIPLQGIELVIEPTTVHFGPTKRELRHDQLQNPVLRVSHDDGSICLQVLEERDPEDYEINPYLRYGRCWVRTGSPAVLVMYFKEWPLETPPGTGELASLIAEAQETSIDILHQVLYQAA